VLNSGAMNTGAIISRMAMNPTITMLPHSHHMRGAPRMIA